MTCTETAMAVTSPAVQSVQPEQG